MKHLLGAFAIVALLVGAQAEARGSHSSASQKLSSQYKAPKAPALVFPKVKPYSPPKSATKGPSFSIPKSSAAVLGVQRDKNGRIARSSAAKNAFKNLHPCPANGNSNGSCPGYVIDHVVPLKRGGADDPSNMQWQTAAEAEAKDKVE